MVYMSRRYLGSAYNCLFLLNQPAGDVAFKLQMPMPVRCSSRFGALLHSLIGAMFRHWWGGRSLVPLARGGEGQPKRRSEGAAKYWSTDQTLKSYLRMNGTWCCAPPVGDHGDHQVCQTQNASKWNWTGLKLSGMKNTRNSWFGGTQASAFWRSRSYAGKSTCESARGHSPSHWCRHSWTCGKESRCFQNQAASRKKSSVASDPCQSLATYRTILTVSFREVLHNE